MLMNNQPNKLCFGWNALTHRLISVKVVKKFNSLVPPEMGINIRALKKSCIAPDRSPDVKVSAVKGHFADITNLRSDDAYSLFKKHSDEAIKAHEKAQYGKRDGLIGYALHFLQDMLNPHHVHFKKLPMSHPEVRAHCKFEEVAQDIERKVILHAAGPVKPMEMFFWDKILPDAMKKAKNQSLETKNIRNDFEQISKMAEESLLNTLDSTDAYMMYLARKFNKAGKANETGLYRKSERELDLVV